MKLVLSDTKTGKTYQKDVSEEQKSLITGKKIGEKLDGGQLGVPGYTFVLTGGSDTSGFPMRTDVAGQKKRKILIAGGVGFWTKRRAKKEAAKKSTKDRKREHVRKGERRKKTVHGNVYSNTIAQVNCKVVEWGQTALDQIFVGDKVEKK